MKSPTDTTGNGEAAVNAAQAAIRRGDWPSAVQIAEAAVAAGADHPMLFNLAAWKHESVGDYDAAGALLSRARELAPHDPRITFAIGRLYLAAGHAREALKMMGETIALKPGFVLAWQEKAAIHAGLGELFEARDCYRQALKIDPKYPDALAGLSLVLARSDDMGEACRLAHDALALKPNHPVSLTTLAMADINAGQFKAAEQRLRDLLTDPMLTDHDGASTLSLLGDALDGQNACAEAFEAYAAANARFAALYAGKFDRPGIETHFDFLRRMSKWMDSQDKTRWAGAAESAKPALQHVFLVGYPRSATTLLENALAGHPLVETLEEKPTLQDADRRFLQNAEGLSDLEKLDGSGAAEWREAYWARVCESGGLPDGKIFIDKSPAAAASLPLIHRLFPSAKILIARRDPRDVVLSCFRRRFTINAVTYEFTDLERTARHFDAMMALTEKYLETIELQHHIVNYTNILSDFDGELERICRFIGLDWDDGVRNFSETARKRNVTSSSASQVRRPLYDGSGQWRRYERQLKPVESILACWVGKPGYS